MALSKVAAGEVLNSNGGMVLVVKDDDGISRLECLLPQMSPSLVILDVMLPDMDRFTNRQKIRETCQVPIIMVTARNQDEDEALGLQMRADNSGIHNTWNLQ